jgi:putative oxidoreductase
MKIAMIIVRTLLGLFLLMGSAVYLFKLMPMPLPEGTAKVYSDGLAVVNLIFIVKVIELICGLAFLSGRYVTLAALVMFPIIVNIIIFHAVVAPAQIGGGLFILLADLFLAYYYRVNYAPLFKSK